MGRLLDHSKASLLRGLGVPFCLGATLLLQSCFFVNDDSSVFLGTRDEVASLNLSELSAESVALAGDTSCAIESDYDLYCWGQNRVAGFGQESAKIFKDRNGLFPEISRFARKIEKVIADPNDAESKYRIEKFSQVVQNQTDICAVSAEPGQLNRLVVCWGATYGFEGKILLKLGANSSTVLQLTVLSGATKNIDPYESYFLIAKFNQIAIGQDFGCGTNFHPSQSSDKTKVYCFGRGLVGRGQGIGSPLPNEQAHYYNDAYEVSVGFKIVDFQVAAHNFCALEKMSPYQDTAPGTLACWGSNLYKQIDSNTGVKIVNGGQLSKLSNASDFKLTPSRLCQYQNNEWTCQGASYWNLYDNNSIGNGGSSLSGSQLGDSFNSIEKSDIETSGFLDMSYQVSSVNVSSDFDDNIELFTELPMDCVKEDVASSDFKLNCRGFLSSSDPGDNKLRVLENQSSVEQVSVHQTLDSYSNLFVEDYSLGRDHGCMISNDFRVYCWGADNRGQLGGTEPNSVWINNVLEPAMVPVLKID